MNAIATLNIVIKPQEKKIKDGGRGRSTKINPKQLTNVCYTVLSHFNHVQFFATLWTVACHAPLSMGFSRQEYWSGLPCFSPGDLPNSGNRTFISTFPVLASRRFTTSAMWEAQLTNIYIKCKLIKCSSQKTYTGWMDTKIKAIKMLSIRDPLQI